MFPRRGSPPKAKRSARRAHDGSQGPRSLVNGAPATSSARRGGRTTHQSSSYSPAVTRRDQGGVGVLARKLPSHRRESVVPSIMRPEVFAPRPRFAELRPRGAVLHPRATILRPCAAPPRPSATTAHPSAAAGEPSGALPGPRAGPPGRLTGGATALARRERFGKLELDSKRTADRVGKDLTRVAAFDGAVCLSL